VNGDRLNDVVTSLSAHGYGLAWYEQTRAANGAISFIQHMIMDDFTTKNAGDVTFTEPHGSTVADVDGDGIPDFIVGKRFFAHLDSNQDPDAYGAPVLYVYRTVRDPQAPGRARFEPELVHNRSGVGSHVWAGDINKDGRTDILTATKFGSFIFWGQAMSAPTPSSTAALAPSGAPASAAAAVTPEVDARQRAIVERVCADCHSLQQALANRYTRAGWIDVINEMAGRGAQATDPEFEAITDYLTRHYGK
jgi:hypothetical protein